MYKIAHYVAAALSLLALYVGLAVLTTALAAPERCATTLAIGASISITGAVGIPITGYRAIRDLLAAHRVATERELYAIVRKHILYDAQLTASTTAPTVVDINQARRLPPKEGITT
ncbi:hypothetical protein ACFYWN_11975 [Streptomyces sp. NPDC002917]|uniref:hypothetical protein n=1 Tax=Streptomyces sp. NPDC002917 TaxID=3364671 RepID=UPI0036842712